MAIATVIATATAMVAVIIKNSFTAGLLYGPCISLAAKQETN